MEVCKIVKNERYIDEFIGLLNYCFGIKKENMEFEIENLFRKDESVIIGVIDQKLLQGALVINDFNMFWNGINVKMGGIGGVATFPEAREKHVVAKLIVEALKIMHDDHKVFSLLDPFSYSFYEKYGWEWGVTRKVLEIDICDLSHFKSGNYSVKPINQKCIPQIKKVYEKQYCNYNGPNKRTNLRWEFLFKKNNQNDVYSYGVYEEESLCGYIFYKIQNKIMEIKDMGYTSLSVRKQLLRFIYVHRAQVDKVMMIVPQNDNTMLLLNNKKQNIKLKSSMMIRVVDVKKLLEIYPYKVNGNLDFSIRIDDEYAPWNNKVFSVSKPSSKVNVEEDIIEQADISCSIQVFSQIMFGFLSFREAEEFGFIRCENKVLLKKINEFMETNSTFIVDSF